MTIKSIAAKASIVIALVAVLNLPGLAQTGSSILTWDLQIPLSDTKDFINRSTITARGAGFQIRRQIRENIWAGGYFAWHVMNGSNEGTFPLEQENYRGAGTGKYWTYINAFPIMANIFYQTGSSRGIEVSVGINAGGYIAEERLEVSNIAFEQSRWVWGFAPEIGIKIPVSYEFSGYIGARYHFGFKNSKTLSEESKGLSYLSINIGLAFDHGFF